MVRQSSKREYAEAVRTRYGRAGKREKGRIFAEFVGATGYHRVYARRLPRTAPGAVEPAPKQRASRPRQYGPAEQGLLRACWYLTDEICSKRLSPFLAELLRRLAACEALPEDVTPAVVDPFAPLRTSGR